MKRIEVTEADRFYVVEDGGHLVAVDVVSLRGESGVGVFGSLGDEVVQRVWGQIEDLFGKEVEGGIRGGLPECVVVSVVREGWVPVVAIRCEGPWMGVGMSKEQWLDRAEYEGRRWLRDDEGGWVRNERMRRLRERVG